MEIFIISHDQQSFDYFKNNNHAIGIDFNHLIVGNKPVKINNKNVKYCSYFHENIEEIPSLLSFTAWYAIARNNISSDNFIGIFEYDTIFKSIPFGLKLDENTIYGFVKRELPDGMFLDIMPGLTSQLTKNEYKNAESMPYWSASSNLIMPVKFLQSFVDWYMTLVPSIIQYGNHSHFHERAINIFAANNKYKIKILDFVKHEYLNSHKTTIK